MAQRRQKASSKPRSQSPRQREESRRQRRELLLAAVAATLMPGRAFAQPAGRKYRVLVLHSAPVRSGPYHNSLKERLAIRGFVDGKNLTLDVPTLNTTGLDWMRMELVKPLSKNPDAIFAFTSRVADAARAEAPAIPLVFVWAADPVTAGIAKDYAKPGGQSTGVANRFSDIAGKRLELLREIAPKIRRVAVAGSTYQPEEAAALAALRPVARELRIELMEVSASPGQITLELQHAFRNGAEAMLPLQIFSALGYRGVGEEIVRLCAKQRAPAIFAESEMVEAGALISYGTNLVDEVRRGADMLAKILRGAKPAEIPIDQASEFELAVNLKTARQMNVQVPAAVLARASRVIE